MELTESATTGVVAAVAAVVGHYFASCPSLNSVKSNQDNEVFRVGAAR